VVLRVSLFFHVSSPINDFSVVFGQFWLFVVIVQRSRLCTACTVPREMEIMYRYVLMLAAFILLEEGESSSRMGLSLRRIILVIAVILCVIIAVFCHLIALITNYWLQSSNPHRNNFLRIGIWQACFDHYKHEHEEDGTEYNGCHDLYSDLYKNLRDWLIPGEIAVYFPSLCLM